MVAAQRLYASEGFVRLPERDWSPQPGGAAARLRAAAVCPRAGV